MVLRILRFLAVLYVALCLTVWLTQRQILYHPDKISLEAATRVASDHGFSPWLNSSGQCIGWKQAGRTPGEHGRLLIVHGNAGSATDRMDYAAALQKVQPLDVYILEYPGYGAREGSPGQQSFLQAADEAFGLLKKEGPVYLMGESIGTGVVAWLAGAYPENVKGVLLLAPYDNLTDVARYHMPLFPVKWLLWDKFPATDHLRSYHGPVAVLLASKDEVIPAKFGRKLYDAYQGPKKLWEAPIATHNDLLAQPDDWWRELAAFWNQTPPGK